MKRTIAIILLCLCMAMTFGGCKKEKEMVETMISTILPTDNTNDTHGSTSDGSVTDNDGFIGNEETSTANESDLIPDTTAQSTTENTDDNVM